MIGKTTGIVSLYTEIILEIIFTAKITFLEEKFYSKGDLFPFVNILLSATLNLLVKALLVFENNESLGVLMLS